MKTELDFFETQKAIKLTKDTFEKKLSKKLRLLRVTAPKFLITGTGLQDDLAGTQKPVSFKTKFLDEDIEIVHSLAKWKRHTLHEHKFKIHTGLYTDMDAIRKDEDVDETHSIYVDQWDWELIIKKEDRKISFLKKIVKKIYSAILETELSIYKEFPQIKQRLPKKIFFIHAQELEKMFPKLSSKEREDAITKKHGAVFIIGIGHKLESGIPHDLRAADYDDWVSETEIGKGLNGDILIWDYERKKSLEISSMGIRVDSESLKKQLKIAKEEHKLKHEFHKKIIKDEMPLTIGGGIGQSRLCMLLLHKKHVGEVHSSVWPKKITKSTKKIKIL